MKFKLLLAAAALIGFGAVQTTATPAAAQSFGPQVCHNNPQQHFHPQSGYSWHRHVGRNCVPVRTSPPFVPPPRDCHGNPERHYLPGYGNVWHRHAGPNCRVQILRQNNRRTNSACVQVGPVWWCP